MRKPRHGSPPADVLELCHNLGDPDISILAEGSVSCASSDPNIFWVKASSRALSTMSDADFVPTRLKPIVQAVSSSKPADKVSKSSLHRAQVSRAAPKPSIEVFMHAALLTLPGVRCVAHTHPTAITAIACSNQFENILQGRVFPEEIIVCGPESAFVRYAEPGVMLGRAVLASARDFINRHDAVPQAIYLKNHGFIALGSTAREALRITLTSIKAAKVRSAAFTLGGLTLLSQADIAFVHRREDINQRRKQFAKA